MLNAEQRALLRQAIIDDKALASQIALADKGGDAAIASAFNAPVEGELLWRDRVTVAELNEAIVWTEFLGLSVELMTAYQCMTADGGINPSRDNVRDALSKIFAGAPATLAAVLAKSQRAPTRLELLLAKQAGGAKASDVTDTKLTAAEVSIALRG